MSEAARDPYAMTWTRHPWDFEGKTFTEWRGASEYHSATVTNFPGDGKTWRATVAGYPYDQRSPYYRTPQGAKARAERYGRPRARRTRKR
jgi:hypothetical protein